MPHGVLSLMTKTMRLATGLAVLVVTVCGVRIGS